VSEHARGFASDNFAAAHPEILAAIAAANEGHAPAYGYDAWTETARERFREHLGADAEAFPVFNGTGANVVGLQAIARPHEAVICPESAHLNEDECGAPEWVAGLKLLPVETAEGKLRPDQVGRWDDRRGDEHHVQPRAVSISNSTELGTVYRPDEVRALADAAHERGMLLHVDGARLANAAASLDVPLRTLTADAGADLLSFGGTKAGLVLGEAVVFLRPGLAGEARFVRKQSMQLASKMRFISAQLARLLEDDLWLGLARKANGMAARLAEAISDLEEVEIAYPVEANAVFAAFPAPAIERLRAELPGETPFHVWDRERGLVRLMCSWDTTEEDVKLFAATLRETLGQPR
jgi:threonine aldolase